MKLNNIKIRLTYRPARIVCDVISLAALVVIVKNAVDLLAPAEGESAFDAGMLPLLFPVLGIGMCAAYAALTFGSMKFKRYNITKQNAQDVYDWWSFFLSLTKIPLLLALFEGEYALKVWTMTGQTPFGITILLYLLLAVIIIRLMSHRIRTLTAVKKTENDNSAVRVKARVADDADTAENGGREDKK